MNKIRSLLVVALLTLIGAAPAAAEPSDTPSSESPTSDESGSLEQEIDPDQEIAADDAVLDVGHVDLGPRYVDGEWSLLVHDDHEAGRSVWRSLDRTVVRVADTAIQESPDDPAYDFLGVPGGTPVHVVPQTQDPEVVWLGWNTQDPEVMDAVDRGVTLSLAAVEGPGDLVVFLQDGGFGEPDPLWDSRTTEPQPLWIDVNTHTHANWVFTEPGSYLVAVTATATLLDGSEESVTGTLRFAVGDATDPATALAAAPIEIAGDAAGPVPDQATDDPGTGGGVSTTVVLLATAAVALLVGLALALVRARRARAAALADPAGDSA